MLKLFTLVFIFGCVYNQESEHIQRVMQEYFEIHSITKLDLQEAIEVFGRVYSGSTPQFMVQVQDKVLNNQPLDDDESALMHFQVYTRRFFTEKYLNVELTKDVILYIIESNEFEKYVEEQSNKDQQYYEKYNDDHNISDEDKLKLPDLDELDAMWEKHEQQNKNQEFSPFENDELQLIIYNIVDFINQKYLFNYLQIMSAFDQAKMKQEDMLRNFEQSLQQNFDKLMNEMNDDVDLSDNDNTSIQKHKQINKKQKKKDNEQLSDHSDQVEIVSKFSEPDNSLGFKKETSLKRKQQQGMNSNGFSKLQNKKKRPSSKISQKNSKIKKRPISLQKKNIHKPQIRSEQKILTNKVKDKKELKTQNSMKLSTMSFKSGVSRDPQRVLNNKYKIKYDDLKEKHIVLKEKFDKLLDKHHKLLKLFQKVEIKLRNQQNTKQKPKENKNLNNNQTIKQVKTKKKQPNQKNLKKKVLKQQLNQNQ